MAKVRKHPTYRGATHTQSVLTITSNVVYGKNTGNTPDGRRKGEPFAPGANPMHGRDTHGWLASCISVARLPYADAQDGISYTVSIAPSLAQRDGAEGIGNAVKAFDAYFGQGGFHMNLNVLSKETLEDAMEHPGEVSAAHHPGVGLRRELRAADPRAAARRDPPHLPRQVLRSARMSELEPIEVGSRHDLRAARSPDAPDTATYEGRGATHGWVHSYETGSTVDGPGIRITLFMSGCLLRCQYCHNPDTWHLKDGTRVELAQAVRRLGDFAPMLRAMGGGLTISGGEPLVQTGLHRRHVRGGQADGPAYRARHLGLPRRARRRRLPRATSIWCCSTSRAAIPTPIAGSPARSSRRPCASPSASPRWASRSGSASCWCRA